MRPVVAALLAVLLVAGCGEVRVPNVVGREVDSAAGTVESADLRVAYRPPPDVGERCMVRRQSRSGAAEPGTTIVLDLSCYGELPNVEDMGAGEARTRIESAGFSATLRPKPEPGTPCKVVRQEPMHYADRGTRVALSLECRLTPSAADRAAKRAIRKDRRMKKRPYTLDPCDVVTQDEAECGLTFMRSRRTECSGLMRVKLRGTRLEASQQEVTCHKGL